jgi:hypothetical protein
MFLVTGFSRLRDRLKPVTTNLRGRRDDFQLDPAPVTSKERSHGPQRRLVEIA